MGVTTFIRLHVQPRITSTTIISCFVCPCCSSIVLALSPCHSHHLLYASDIPGLYLYSGGEPVRNCSQATLAELIQVDDDSSMVRRGKLSDSFCGSLRFGFSGQVVRVLCLLACEATGAPKRATRRPWKDFLLWWSRFVTELSFLARRDAIPLFLVDTLVYYARLSPSVHRVGPEPLKLVGRFQAANSDVTAKAPLAKHRFGSRYQAATRSVFHNWAQFQSRLPVLEVHCQHPSDGLLAGHLGNQEDLEGNFEILRPPEVEGKLDEEMEDTCKKNRHDAAGMMVVMASKDPAVRASRSILSRSTSKCVSIDRSVVESKAAGRYLRQSMTSE